MSDWIRNSYLGEKGLSFSPMKIFLSVLFVIAIVVGYFAYQWFKRSGDRTRHFLSWMRNPASHSDWIIHAGTRCREAPFTMPTTGLIGFLWDDSFRPGHHHQGIDIFSGKEAGKEAVYSAFSGFLSRLPDWKSSVIIRIPEDPLHPGRQIWTYYTHLADKDGKSYIEGTFPPGTSEIYVEAGTLLGYQGDYSGDPNNPVGVHLHFSIVRDDGYGSYRNELDIGNTLDPSPYLGLPLNANTNPNQVPTCKDMER